MSTTVSKVLRNSTALNEFLQKQCALVAEYGGTFAIREILEANWMIEYTVNWPAGVEVAA